jgi:copper transport protein
VRRLAVIVLVALAFPASAFAHASLTGKSPSYRERMSTPPHAVVLRFDQTIELLPKAIVVLDRHGKSVAGETRLGTRALIASLPRLPRGPYTVRWRAMSNDGHVVSGVYTFGVGVAAPPVTDAVGAQGPTRVEHVVRWSYFVALALLVGGLGFRLLTGTPLSGRAEKRFFVVTGIGAFGVLEVGIVAFLLRAEDALQLPFANFLYGDLSPIAGGTRFGVAFTVMELGFALVTALLFLAWLTGRRALLWAAFLLGLGFASGLSLSGHSADGSGSRLLPQLADWVHLSAAMLWVGGLVQLVAVVWPGAPELRRAAFLRFSRLATVLVGVLLVAGTYLSILRLPHVHDLWRTGYGHILLVKLGLVAVALAWGAVHHFLAVPRIERGGVVGSLSRSMLGESAVAMAVLLAAAVLVDSKPPPPSAPGKAPIAAQRP